MYVLHEKLLPDMIKESKHTPAAAVKHTDQIVMSENLKVIEWHFIVQGWEQQTSHKLREEPQ